MTAWSQNLINQPENSFADKKSVATILRWLLKVRASLDNQKFITDKKSVANILQWLLKIRTPFSDQEFHC